MGGLGVRSSAAIDVGLGGTQPQCLCDVSRSCRRLVVVVGVVVVVVVVGVWCMVYGPASMISGATHRVVPTCSLNQPPHKPYDAPRSRFKEEARVTGMRALWDESTVVSPQW